MSGNINHWIESYGAFGVFVAAAAEGELGVLVGGALAHLGKLNFASVAMAGGIGSFVSTQAFFHLARSQRQARLVRKVRDSKSFTLARKRIEQYPRLFCFFYRFVYGFRVAGPVGISLSDVETRTFTILNLFSALLWGIGAALLGWYAGPSVGRFLQHWFSWKRVAIASVVILLLLVCWLAWRSRSKGDD